MFYTSLKFHFVSTDYSTLQDNFEFLSSSVSATPIHLVRVPSISSSQSCIRPRKKLITYSGNSTTNPPGYHLVPWFSNHDDLQNQLEITVITRSHSNSPQSKSEDGTQKDVCWYNTFPLPPLPRV